MNMPKKEKPPRKLEDLIDSLDIMMLVYPLMRPLIIEELKQMEEKKRREDAVSNKER